ncbi:MAG TPA: hypothetical protein VM491_24560, partial [Burkholderiaceae bacterium]|nr:hypothetical protein [Burkholderiaceae bacterium]
SERRDAAADRLYAKREALAAARAEADAFVHTHAPIDAEALGAQRSRRDSLWRAIRGGARSAAADGDAYEAEVARADAMADHRYASAAVVEQAQALAVRVRTLEAEAMQLQRQAQDSADELSALQAEWLEIVTAIGLPHLLPEQLSAWATQRDAALAAADALQAAEADEQAVRQRIAEVLTQLREALDGAEAKLGDPPGAAASDRAAAPSEQSAARGASALSALVARAEAGVARRTELRGQLASLREQHANALILLSALRRQAADAEAARTDCIERRNALLQQAGLRPDLGASGIDKALAIFNEIDQFCRLLAHQQPRVDAMRGEIAQFARDASALARDCGLAADAYPPVAIAEALSERLRAAESAETERLRLAKSIGSANDALDALDGERAAAQGTLRPLLEAAGVDTIDALRAAIELSARCRESEQRLRDARDAVVTLGDGLPIERLREEVAAEDPDAIDALLQQTREARTAAQQRRDEHVARRTQARDRYESIGGQDAAARAEAERQDALLMMGEAADEYARLAVGARLLAWAIGRYCEERQEPLLALASRMFAKLTLCAYDRLSVSPDDAGRPV